MTISIDLELAWGNWDNLDAGIADRVERLERPIVGRLVDLFDRHEFPVTFAFVAALLDPEGARGRPGDEKLWYAPDLIERIAVARAGHDLGSHGGHHLYFDQLTDAEADAELGYARALHDRHGLAFESFVFPRNMVARTDRLGAHGLKVYRGTDHAWHERLRAKLPAAGRLANLVDKMVPVAPATVRPEADGRLTNLPGSLLLMGRNGLRKLIPESAMRTKLAAGLEAAQRHGGTFHLWFHPSNFWHDTDRQFALFEDFIARAAAMRDRGALDVMPMAAFA